jgi:AcrR family transcriptional regulator
MVHSATRLPGRRERKRQARIDGILSTAMGLVMQEGLEACTIHRLAKELDLAVGALYRYFPSKGAIIAALELRVINDYKVELNEALEEGEKLTDGLAPIAQRLFPLVQAAWEYERLARVESFSPHQPDFGDP